MEKKKLWLRAGISVKLTAEQFKEVEAQSEKGRAILRDKILAGNFILDGETYAPAGLNLLPDQCWIPSEEIEFCF